MIRIRFSCGLFFYAQNLTCWPEKKHFFLQLLQQTLQIQIQQLMILTHVEWKILIYFRHLYLGNTGICHQQIIVSFFGNIRHQNYTMRFIYKYDQNLSAFMNYADYYFVKNKNIISSILLSLLTYWIFVTLIIFVSR